jgi:hypothetical protein
MWWPPMSLFFGSVLAWSGDWYWNSSMLDP